MLNPLQYPNLASSWFTSLILELLASFDLLSVVDLTLFKCQALLFPTLLASNLLITQSLVHPQTTATSPRTQYLAFGFSLTHLRASLTENFLVQFKLSGTPSKHLTLPIAAAPMAVLCGIIPLIFLSNIYDGDFQWISPLLGLVLILLFLKSMTFNLFLYFDPETRAFSHLTIVTFYPFKASLATQLANLPTRCPFASTTINFLNILNGFNYYNNYLEIIIKD